MSVRIRTAVIAALLALAGSAACAPEDETGTPAASGSASASASADACTKEQLDLVTDGTFTVGTDKPAYEPWFVDDDPTNGKGFESAVAYAVAEQLGFDKAEVKWIVVPFTNAYAPGDKKFDIDINQVSISDARRKAVDFSSGYYDVTQTVISVKGAKIEGAASVADSQGGQARRDGRHDEPTPRSPTQIQPTAKPSGQRQQRLAVQALQNGQIDGLVVDLPTAFYIGAAQLDDGKIMGQLPRDRRPRRSSVWCWPRTPR